MIGVSQIAVTGLKAASQRLQAVSQNLSVSSVESRLSGEDGVYDGPKSVDAQNSAQKNGGVQSRLVERDPGFVKAYAPQSSVADEQGYVGMPQVDVSSEMVRMKQAEHAYKAAASLIKVDNELHETLMQALED